MLYKWSNVYKELKKITAENVVLSDAGATEDFLYLLDKTDMFHPFNTDAALAHALDYLPNYCNYRNFRALQDYRERKEELMDALYYVFAEIEHKVENHFKSAWERIPGYTYPTVKWKVEPEDLAVSVATRIIRVARK